MKSKRRTRLFSATVAADTTTTTTTTADTTTATTADIHSSQENNSSSQIPISSPHSTSPILITVHFPTTTDPSIAATKIQSSFRSHTIKTLYRKISIVNSEANYLQHLIQRQETVDAVRSDDRERIKMNEALMGLLLRLDSVPGFDPTVRELRRHVSRQIVGLQEIMDAVSGSRVENWDGFLKDWDDIVERMEVEVCEERGGGYEMERFCAKNLGFRCLEKFLRDQ